MKQKTIKAVLTKKFNKFANSITDANVRALVRENTIITGGAIASMLQSEPVNDYDLYFTTKETTVEVANYYITQFIKLNKAAFDGEGDLENLTVEATDDRVKIVYHNPIFDEEIATLLRPVAEANFKFDEGPEVTESSDTKPKYRPVYLSATKPKYRPVYLSANAITLSDKFQLIIRFFGDAEEIHENYDFEHCKCYWTSKDQNLVLPSSAVVALMTKELIYTGSKYPLASIIRTRKFLERGFTCNAGQYLKMCMQLNDLDLRDIKVLEDQLVGMDSAYFASMLAAIPEDRKINNRVDSSYLFTMIDKFF